MRYADWRSFFCPNEVTNRTHSRGYVEDSRAQTGGERCTKMTVLSLSVLPLYGQKQYSFDERER
nr:hypothetical protein [Selenomonas sp. oral taxon 136]